MALPINKFGERQGAVTIVSGSTRFKMASADVVCRQFGEKSYSCIVARGGGGIAGGIRLPKVDSRLPAKAKEAAMAEALFDFELLKDLDTKSIVIGLIAGLSLWVLLN